MRRTPCDIPDEELIQGLLDDDVRGFEIYIETHKGRVFRQVLRLGVLWEDAREVVQSTFFEFGRAIRVPQNSGFVRTPDRLLFRIARFRAVESLRKRVPFKEIGQPEEADQAETVEATSPSPDLWAQYGELLDIVRTLPWREAVVVAALLRGDSHEDVAQQLMCSVGNARLMRHRVVLKLRSALLGPPRPRSAEKRGREPQ